MAVDRERVAIVPVMPLSPSLPMNAAASSTEIPNVRATGAKYLNDSARDWTVVFDEAAVCARTFTTPIRVRSF